MRTITFLAARGVIIDRKSNNVSVFSLVEQINAASAPVIFQSLSVLFMAERSASEPERWSATLTLSINEKKLGSFPSELNFDGKARTRLVIEIGALVIPDLGRFKLEFAVKDSVTAVYEIDVAASAELANMSKQLFEKSKSDPPNESALREIAASSRSIPNRKPKKAARRRIERA